MIRIKGEEVHVADRNRVVAVGLLTERDLSVLGNAFTRAYRLPEDETFRDLLIQIDTADAPGIQVVRPGVRG